MMYGNIPRYDPRRSRRAWERAVVVGGSVAGLLAGRVLADHFDEVVVLERDAFPSGPEPRSGAPQTNHPHALLEAGRRALEDLFPGFGESLLSAGGLLVDASRDVGHYAAGGFLADGPTRLPMYCASRPLFEHVVREHVRALDPITLRGECTFSEFTHDGDRVTGVSLRDETGEPTTVPADLVVDATGRTSRTPSWLDDHGYPTPPTDRVEIDVQYASTRIERPPGDRRVFLAPPEPPRARGVYFIPIENDQWEVLLQGMHGTTPPTDRERFEAFARDLPVDELADLIETQPWVTQEPHAYPFPASQRRHYEALDRFPGGLVVTGDAVASFNPIYGQGMSVAALDALALHDALARGSLDSVGPRVFDTASDAVDDAWQLAVGSDFQFPQTTGVKPPGTDLFNRYLSRFLRKAHDDPVLAEAFARVVLLDRPPKSLLRPEFVWRTLRPTDGEAAATTPTPARNSL